MSEGGRAETVKAMLANNARRAPGYWIQLVLAAGIATLGLVLNSTAVVIGAMLVSPLMGPIIELGMGFAVGSSLLVMRASLRVALSVVVAVVVAMLLTLSLPFHEVTAEVSARAAPTALDLLVAIFCALTAAYTTVRPGADSTAAAAGTAIGIALVPPLCAVGFGIGTFSGTVTAGASLLFTANLSAILVLSVFSFLLLGFNRVDAERLEASFTERDETRTGRLAARFQSALALGFGSRHGVPMRLLVPVLFLGAVYVPLRSALNEVTWEVHARDAVRRLVHEASPGAVQTQVTIERRTLALRLLVVAAADAAIALEDSLTARIGRATGVVPSVSVIAVPNARSLLAQAAAEARMPASSVRPVEPARDLRQAVASALAAEWPAAAGPLGAWTLTMFARDTVRLTVWHLGAPIGAVAEALLSRSLAAHVHAPVVLASRALPAAPVAVAAGGTTEWLQSARAIVNEIAQTDSVVACARAPVRRLQPASMRRALAALRATDLFRAGRLTIAEGATLDLRAALRSCDGLAVSAAAPPA